MSQLIVFPRAVRIERLLFKHWNLQSARFAIFIGHARGAEEHRRSTVHRHSAESQSGKAITEFCIGRTKARETLACNRRVCELHVGFGSCTVRNSREDERVEETRMLSGAFNEHEDFSTRANRRTSIPESGGAKRITRTNEYLIRSVFGNYRRECVTQRYTLRDGFKIESRSCGLRGCRNSRIGVN